MLLAQGGSLEKIIEDATIDCNSEEEQIAGWACTFEDSIPTPCNCFVGKEQAVLERIEQNGGSNAILGIWAFRRS